MSEPCEVWFYHLERSSLDQILPELLENLEAPVDDIAHGVVGGLRRGRGSSLRLIGFGERLEPR